ncbi:hypothetical protein AVEN_90002-1 [Araneus ventricosus]|uniref:Transposon Ty3-I Gag-Pol polyprotein n=1 Tax=Araneus ventricosus TaxID=182803 RepID=A0A4Y2DCB3_ARAVE|nr:hypothetical protein AVEN_90002-1 [Araneus ventricosus]
MPVVILGFMNDRRQVGTKVEVLVANHGHGPTPTEGGTSRHRSGDTQIHPPVAVPPYRVSPVRKDNLNAEINLLLNGGIIEPCDSPYAAPVVLVPKPIGRFRLCVDYRKLNSVTKIDVCLPFTKNR